MEQFKAFQKVTTTPLHNHLPTDKKINKEEGNTTEKGGNSQEEPQSQGRKKKKKLQPSSPLQHLMNNFSEKQLIATLSTCPFEEILLQATAVPHQVPKKSQTLLEFILSDRNRTQLFLKQIANDYKLTENFIRSYAKILDFYNKLPSSKLSGKKLFDQFCRLIHKTLKFEIINNSNLVHLAALLGDIEHFDLLHKLGANFDIANSYGLTPLYVAVSYGHITLIDKFYQYKADFNKATNAGGTPAIAAAYKGNANMIKKLHERGANLNKADSAGIT
ncbi:ankyrin repeat domain-containing protein, partial [Legionella jamestowniensis]